MFSLQLLFFDISGGEFLVILLAIFLIFGPKKMPEIARKVGRAMNELKKASSDITREFREETESITREISSTREALHREGEALKSNLMDTERKIEKNLEIQPTGIARDDDITSEVNENPAQTVAVGDTTDDGSTGKATDEASVRKPHSSDTPE